MGDAIPGNDESRHQVGQPVSFRDRVLLGIVSRHRFVRWRWGVIAGALALLGMTRLLDPSGFVRPWFQLVFWLVLLAVVNLVWAVVSGVLLPADRGADGTTLSLVQRVVLFADAQIAADLLVLTLVLRYSGGVENPLSIFYLPHMLVAGLLLPPRHALLQGAWAAVAYGGLGLGEYSGWVRPHFPFMSSTADAMLYADSGYVLARVGVLSAGMLGTLFLAIRISSRLYDQEHALREANESLARSQASIELQQRRRSRFMRTAVHQLRSPLTGIEMLATLIRDKVASGEKADDLVARIILRCREAVAQVTELLTLERIEQGGTARPGAAETAVSDLVERVAGRFAEQAAHKGLTLRVDVEHCSRVLVAVDLRSLEDCIANLVENAIAYTEAGGNIELRASRCADGVSISVKDSGMGIVEQPVDGLFEPFRRGELAIAHRVPGSGLGLTIVREVVKQANGSITVMSAPGEGSEFIVSFPVEPPKGGNGCTSG